MKYTRKYIYNANHANTVLTGIKQIEKNRRIKTIGGKEVVAPATTG